MYLGRTIRWTENGIEVEGNEKHLKELLKCTGLEACRPVSTPLTPEDLKDNKDNADEKKLDSGETKMYRKATALIVYMAQDRPDLSMAACHLARYMQSPTQESWTRLKRVCRYLKGHPRCVMLYRWQSENREVLKLQTDSDWANDSRTRKSHSGGVIMCGDHLLQHWSRIQPVIALSSGEAELYSSVCGLSRFAGLLNLLRELRGETWGHPQHDVDASACKSILMRKGPGGVKHIDTKFLWVQELIRRKDIKVTKVVRTENAADSLASYSAVNDLHYHLRLLRCQLRDVGGRVLC